MFKVVQAKKDNTLGEISQDLNIRFSFAKYNEEKEEVLRLHELVRCRDFLGDVIWANTYNDVTSIYGFKVDPSITTIDPEHTILLLEFPNKTSKEAFFANFEHIVHKVEKTNDLELTKLVEGEENNVLVIGDKLWQSAIFLISLYTYLLKSSGYKYKNVKSWREEIKELGVVESRYMAKTYTIWTKVINKLKDIRKSFEGVSGLNDEAKAHISQLHNNCGFVSVIGNCQFMDKENGFAKYVKAIV